MRRRVLITGGGTGASNNLIRSLRAGDSTLFIVASNADRFVLKKSSADRKYVVPTPESAAYLPALRRLVEAERIDVAIPTGDADVRAFSDLRHRLPCRLFLPARAVIDRCQDKYVLTEFLRSRGLPAPGPTRSAGSTPSTRSSRGCARDRRCGAAPVPGAAPWAPPRSRRPSRPEAGCTTGTRCAAFP